MGFFAQVRENFWRTFGLGRDQDAEERIVGLVRLAMALGVIALVWWAGTRILGGAFGVAERAATRTTGLIGELKDVQIPPGYIA